MGKKHKETPAERETRQKSYCHTCNKPFVSAAEKRHVCRNYETKQLWAWHTTCDYPEGVKKLLLDDPTLKPTLVNADGPTYMTKEEVFRLMQIKVKEDNTEMTEAQVNVNAQAIADVWWAENYIPEIRVIPCVCLHANGRHIGGVGRCKEPHCECQEFESAEVVN